MKTIIYKKTDKQDKWAGSAESTENYIIIRCNDATLHQILLELFKRPAYEKVNNKGTVRFIPISGKVQGFFYNIRHQLPAPFYIRLNKITPPDENDIKYTKYLDIKERGNWKSGE